MLLDSNNLKDQNDDSKYSFRELRQIPRHNVIHMSDQIIGRFSDILIDASSMRPAVNISSLLGLREHKPNSYTRPEVKVNPFTFIGKKEVKQVNVLKTKATGKDPEQSLFEVFLSHLDLAATAFSHLEYTVAQGHLREAGKVQEKLKELVGTLLSMRSGSYTCKDMRKESRIEALERRNLDSKDGMNTNNNKIKHVKGKHERQHETNRRWTWLFGIIGSVLLGCLIGYDVATSKVKRGLE